MTSRETKSINARDQSIQCPQWRNRNLWEGREGSGCRKGCLQWSEGSRGGRTQMEDGKGVRGSASQGQELQDWGEFHEGVV